MLRAGLLSRWCCASAVIALLAAAAGVTLWLGGPVETLVLPIVRSVAPVRPRPELCSHQGRGLASFAPEHLLASLDALSRGVLDSSAEERVLLRCFDLDVVSLAGELVVAHPGVLPDLRARGAKPPSLASVLQWWASRLGEVPTATERALWTLSLEPKSLPTTAFASFLHALEALPDVARERVFVATFMLEDTAAAQVAAPHVRWALVFRDETPTKEVRQLCDLDSFPGVRHTEVPMMLKLAREEMAKVLARVDLLMPSVKVASRCRGGLLALLQGVLDTRGVRIRVHAWTVDTAKDLNELHEAGVVHSVISNEPLVLAARLRHFAGFGPD